MFVPVVHLLSMLWGSTVHENITLFILFLMDIWISLFPFLWSHYFQQYILKYMFMNFSRLCTRSGIVGSFGVYVFILLDNSKLFFRMFVPLNFLVQLFYNCSTVSIVLQFSSIVFLVQLLFWDILTFLKFIHIIYVFQIKIEGL